MLSPRVIIAFTVILSGCTNAIFVFPKMAIPPAGPPNPKSVEPEWDTIDLRIDQFGVGVPDSNFNLRYMKNGQFFQPGGPMFVLLGGAWEIQENYMRTGQMFDMAEQHNGYMFYLEHRYYGRSLPTHHLTTNGAVFLATDQCIADIAYFIDHQKQNISGLSNSKVIVIGASHSASLATWARMKLPHLVNIAIASSAPLRAVEDFYEYNEVVSEMLEQESHDCVKIIREATGTLENAFKDDNEIRKIEKEFNTCAPIKREDPHRAFFFYQIAQIFGTTVQYAKNGDLAANCKILLDHEGTSVQKLAAFVREQWGSCMGGYDEFIRAFNETESINNPDRPWLLQMCTEFGYFPTGTSTKQPFSNLITLDLFYNMCQDIFGERFGEVTLRESVKVTNVIYGSVNIDVTKLITTQGTSDPFHKLGLQHDLPHSSPTILIKGASHAEDLSSVSASDSEEMRAAKMRVKELITKWLHEKR